LGKVGLWFTAGHYVVVSQAVLIHVPRSVPLPSAVITPQDLPVPRTRRLPEEAPVLVPGHEPPEGWPSQGAIEARRLTVRYRPDLPPVLHELRCVDLMPPQ
jgi:hypothetical protein